MIADNKVLELITRKWIYRSSRQNLKFLVQRLEHELFISQSKIIFFWNRLKDDDGNLNQIHLLAVNIKYMKLINIMYFLHHDAWVAAGSNYVASGDELIKSEWNVDLIYYTNI